MASVFISYSLKDREFARKLHAALQEVNRDSWIDWRDIPPTATWLHEIFAGIESAENFLFIISPDSIASESCLKEVAHAAKNNKRLIPLLWRTVTLKELPPPLADIQSIPFSDADRFNESFEILLRAIDTDLDLWHLHTRLLQRAIEWESKDRNSSFLLRGKELEEAEQWITRISPSAGGPRPTHSQSEYILLSRRYARHRQRLTFTFVALGLVLSSSLALAAYRQAILADRQQQLALARLAGSQSLLARNQRGSLEQSALLAAEALQRSTSVGIRSLEADEALRGSIDALGLGVTPHRISLKKNETIVDISRSGQFVATLDGDHTLRIRRLLSGLEVAQFRNSAHVWYVAFSPDEKYVAALLDPNLVKLWDVDKNQEIANVATEKSASWLQQDDGALKPNDAEDIFWFTPDGSYLLVKGRLSIELWRVSTGRRTARFEVRTREPIDDFEFQSFSPDGKLLAILCRIYRYSAPGSNGLSDVRLVGVRTIIQLVGIPTGRAMFTLEGGRSVTFSPDNRSFVTVDVRGTARLWTLPEAKEVTRLKGLKSARKVTFSPSGKSLATVGLDGGVGIWQVATGRKETNLKQTGYVDDLVFSHNKEYLVTLNYSDAAHLWDLSTLREVDVVHQRSWTRAEFSPDDKYLATVSSDGARLYDISSRKEVALIPKEGDDAWRVFFTPDGKHLAVQQFPSRSVRLWTLSESNLGSSFMLSGTRSIAFAPDGRYVATAGFANTVHVWDAETRSIYAKLTHTDLVGPLELASQRNHIHRKQREGAVARVQVRDMFDFSAEASLDDISRMALIRKRPAIGDAAAIAVEWKVSFSADGKYIATAGGESVARVWETATGHEVVRLPHQDLVDDIAFVAPPNYLATASSDETVRVWEIPSGREILQIKRGPWIKSLVFSVVGRLAVGGAKSPYSGGINGVKILEVPSGRNIAYISSSNLISNIALSPDGRYLAIDDDVAKVVRVYALPAGHEVSLLRNIHNLKELVFDSSGRHLAVVEPEEVQLWNVERNQMESVVRHGARSLSFSSDGNLLATSEQDQRVTHVWDVATGQEVARPTNDATVWSVAFSPNAKYLGVAGDPYSRLWPMQSADLIGEVCGRVTRNLSLDEWHLYFGDFPYHKTCNNLP